MKKRFILLILVVVVLGLVGCASGKKLSVSPEAPNSSTMKKLTLSGTTTDGTLLIDITDVDVTTSTIAETNIVTVVAGTFEIENLTDSPIPTASINFGVLDKKNNVPYWGGAMQIYTVDAIAPHATVQGTFSIQIPVELDVKNCDLIFGALPQITFEKPLPINK